jgi:hypothetical protein
MLDPGYWLKHLREKVSITIYLPAFPLSFKGEGDRG